MRAAGRAHASRAAATPADRSRPVLSWVVDGLTDGAQRLLREAGATFETLDIAGAFELPQAIRIAVRGAAHFDGFVALGCVVRGETDHYDHICRETMPA